jgi:hypothetical protein
MGPGVHLLAASELQLGNPPAAASASYRGTHSARTPPGGVGNGRCNDLGVPLPTPLPGPVAGSLLKPPLEPRKWSKIEDPVPGSCSGRVEQDRGSAQRIDPPIRLRRSLH